MSRKASSKGDRGKAAMYATPHEDTSFDDEIVDSFRNDDS